jgi:hypothetical protein
MSLSNQSRAILEAIAKGHTYEQILVQELAWTYHDIFQAAAEALEVSMSGSPAKTYAVEAIRHEHPKAYEKWDGTRTRSCANCSRRAKRWRKSPYC